MAGWVDFPGGTLYESADQRMKKIIVCEPQQKRDPNLNRDLDTYRHKLSMQSRIQITN